MVATVVVAVGAGGNGYSPGLGDKMLRGAKMAWRRVAFFFFIQVLVVIHVFYLSRSVLVSFRFGLVWFRPFTFCSVLFGSLAVSLC